MKAYDDCRRFTVQEHADEYFLSINVLNSNKEKNPNEKAINIDTSKVNT